MIFLQVTRGFMGWIAIADTFEFFYLIGGAS